MSWKFRRRTEWEQDNDQLRSELIKLRHQLETKDNAVRRLEILARQRSTRVDRGRKTLRNGEVVAVRNARGQAKREREFYGRENLQKCAVCGRLFVRRKDNVCSIACSEKARKIDESRPSHL
jgi:hypothetical protein